MLFYALLALFVWKARLVLSDYRVRFALCLLALALFVVFPSVACGEVDIFGITDPSKEVVGF